MGRAPHVPCGRWFDWVVAYGRFDTVIRALKLLPRYITEKSWEPGSYG